MITRSLEAIIRMLDADYIEQGNMNVQIKGVCIDSRKAVAGNLYVPLIGARADGHAFVKEAIQGGVAATLWKRDVPNPPADIPVLIVDDTLDALQRLAKAYREQLSCRIIGITGSNGKTSTKDIAASILSQTYRTYKTLGNQNNEIGVPLTLLALADDAQAAVVEMGIETMDEMDLLSEMVQPDIAIITNIGEAHLVNMGSKENIAIAKCKIVKAMKPKGLLIYNGDQKVLRDAVARLERDDIELATFGIQPGNDLQITALATSMDHISFSINQEAQRYELDMIGAHNACNAAAAMLAGFALGMCDEAIQRGLNHVEKTGLRNEVTQIGEMLVLNDSYKSNPQSVEAALDTFDTIQAPYKIVVLGDMLDLGEEEIMIHYHCGKELAKHAVDEVLTYGELSAFLCQGASNVLSCPCFHFTTHAELIEYLKPYLKKTCAMLIKGSRGMHLDEVVEALKGSK